MQQEIIELDRFATRESACYARQTGTRLLLTNAIKWQMTVVKINIKRSSLKEKPPTRFPTRVTELLLFVEISYARLGFVNVRHKAGTTFFSYAVNRRGKNLSASRYVTFKNRQRGKVDDCWLEKAGNSCNDFCSPFYRYIFFIYLYFPWILFTLQFYTPAKILFQWTLGKVGNMNLFSVRHSFQFRIANNF